MDSDLLMHVCVFRYHVYQSIRYSPTLCSMLSRRSSRLTTPASTTPTTPLVVNKKRKIKQEVEEEKTVKVDMAIPVLKRKKPRNGETPKLTNVDIFVPGSVDFEVVINKGLSLTAMLNQTNLAQNNNKFYLIQVLVRDGVYYTWFRWGRVGYSGQTNLQRFDSFEAAFSVFTDKFLAKTDNSWGAGVYSKFVTCAGRYTLLPVDTLTRALDDANGCCEVSKIEHEPTKLDPSTYELIKLISSKEMFERELRIAGIDLTKMPLGKMSPKMISDGYKILKKIEQTLEIFGSNRDKLICLSNEFYTVIPHNFGFTKGINYVVNSFGKLKEKIELMESLVQVIQTEGDLQAVVLRVNTTLSPNPVDEHYIRMRTKIVPLPVESPEYQMILRYKTNTQGGTHNLRTRICSVFKVIHSTPPATGTTLLWHGSRLTNWYSILTHGLKIAPPEAPHTGFMFDKGIYTADCFSKSANYCFADRVGLMVLCEVDLGNSMQLTAADHDAKTKLGSRYHSTMGVGLHYPDPTATEIFDGMTVPCGKLIKRLEPTSEAPRKPSRSSRLAVPQGLQYNEYVVYDTSRIRIRYLVQLEFGRDCSN